MKQLSQKLFLAVFLVLCASTHLLAQLTGLKTIGTAGNYITFAAAVTDLNGQGVGAGGVIFEFIDNGGGNFIENSAATVSITTTTATAANTIVFRPSATVGTVTILANFGAELLILNGTDYVTFDGRNGGIGTNKNITFDNASTIFPTVLFNNSATNNNFINVKIVSRNTTITSGAIAFSSIIVGGNNNNVLDNCEISGDGTGFPVNGIYANGSSATFNNDNNTVRNCLIYDYFIASGNTTGIYVNTNNNTWTIQNNRFYQTATRIYTSANPNYAIRILAGSGHNVSNNIIGYNDALGASIGFTTMTSTVGITYIAIDVAAGVGATSNIKGNIIRNINLTTSSGSTFGVFRGIQVSTGNVNIGGTGLGEGNEIGDNATGSINVTSSSTNGLIVGIINASIGTISIDGNKVGSIKGNGSATVAYSIIGIYSVGAGSVSNNTIGSPTQANSIQNITTAAPNFAILMHGIYITNPVTVTIDNNIIANLTNGYSGTNISAITRGIHTVGTMTGALSVTNNQIYNISTRCIQDATGYANAVLGGITCNTGNPIIINSNKVYNLRQTGTTGDVIIYGIFPNATTSSIGITNNLVYNLFASSNSATTTIYGLRMPGTAATCANNVVRLGENSTNTHVYYGISDLGSNTNYYYNSVYIGGVSASTGAKSFAFANDANGTRNVRNNIFVNLRTNTGAGASKHYAATFSTSGTLTSNYNIFYANTIDGIAIGRGVSALTPVQYTSYKAYRIIYPALEVNSAFGNPQLLDPTNATAPDLSLGLLSPAFQTGTPVVGVLNDYANVVRSATTPNIGAYETATTPQNATTDIFTPIITYVPLSTPYGVATGIRTLTATITDMGVGVPTAGANVPTLWYQNLSSGSAWTSVLGTLMLGTGNNGTWEFILDQDVLALIAGQSVSYYVVAQDVATVPNIWYNVLDATVNHTSVSGQVAAPATPNTYIISGAMAGVYNVPGDFNSLTKIGGIFQAINNSTISGNITVNVTANLDENGTFGVNTWADGAFNYSLNIQPNAGVQRIISNSANVATGITMIKINTDVDNTIDGRFAGAGRFLLFRNTNTTPFNTGSTISYTNTTAAKQSILQYVVVENNADIGGVGNVVIGVGTNNVDINNCLIGDATGGTIGRTRKGISESSGTANIINVQNNEIYNFQDNGIVLTSCANGAIISGNKFYKNIVTNPSNTVVIGIYANGGHIISNNGIGGQNNTNTGGNYDYETNNTFIGITIVGTNANNTLANNTIQNITLSQIHSPRFGGIAIGNLSRATITDVTINNITITAATGTPSIQGLALGLNPCTVSGTNTFTNMSMFVNNTGYFHVISCLGVATYNISGCTISNITSRTTPLLPTTTSGFAGIVTLGGGSLTVDNCTLFNMFSNGGSELRAIFQNGGSGIGVYTRNRIHSLSSTSGAILGISANNGDFTTANNQISIQTANAITLIGIHENTTTTKVGNHYFNTVYIGGAQGTGATSSYAYRRETSNSNTTLRNNIFINERTGGTGNHYAIAANSTTTWSANYNLLIAKSTGNNNIGLTNATSGLTFAAWKTAQGGDANSWTAIAGATTDHSNIIVANLFTNLAIGNLNIQPANAESWYANGKGIAIAGYTGDYGSMGVVRSGVLANGGTDLGSDEFLAVTTPIAALVGGSHTVGGTETFTFGGRQIAQIVWGAGTLPTLGDMFYFSGENPPSPSAGARYFNAYWRLDEVVAGAGYDYEMTLNYDKALLGTITLPEDASNTICLSKKPSAGTLWTTYTVGSTHISGSNTVAKGALDSFSQFTGSIFVAPLPLTLLSFDAKRQNDTQIALNWLTVNELNLDYFVVERSYDAKSFIEVARVSAENPTQSIKNYILSVDEKKAVYFRLKFIHYQQNGVQNADDSYSKVIFVGNGEEKESILVYPNPMNANNLSNVHFEVSKSLQNEFINLQITDNQGKKVVSFVGTFAEIENIFSQNKLNLASGVYIWRFVVNNKTIKTLKISVE